MNAYDLILKDKERLLSFDEPTRFIFSHSALREGWDNPNIFVICTLKHSDSTVARRQEVGRGMRLCVNKHGERMDDPSTVHEINVLSIVANESYKDFAKGLQKEIAESLTDRPKTADVDYFKGKVLPFEEEKVEVNDKQARQIVRYLLKNDYVDDDGKITETYIQARENGNLAPLPEDLQPYSEAILLLVDSVYSDVKLPAIENEFSRKENPLNEENLKRKEFLALWENINQKAVYAVHFDTKELVVKAVGALDRELKVPEITYRVVEGEMESDVDGEEIRNGEGFRVREDRDETTLKSIHSEVTYDLIGKLAEETQLTRKTIGAILRKISDRTFSQFKKNPEIFIREAARIINEQKAATVIEHLSYDKREEKHRLEEIFVPQNSEYKRLQEVQKHVYQYLVTDSGKEKEFAEALDSATEVVVYAKLPSAFFIPTPVGDYNPDWAIAFEEGSVKHIYFVAETKGSLSSMQLRKIEEMKIECARKFFENIATDKVKYDVVDSFDRLMTLVRE